MRPQLRRVGTGGHPVVVVDDATGNAGAVVEIAAALAPFPPAGTHFPGLRRIVGPGDAAANGYVDALLERIAPLIAGAFDLDRFDLAEASFSLVTARAAALAPPQRMPHFDAVDPDYLAILHYLTPAPGSGTAFYRQRATGVERVDEGNRARFIAAARRDGGALTGYTNASNLLFEQTEAVEAAVDRLLIYQGAVLHSGIIPDSLVLSADPRRGRLTANIFVQGRR